MALLGLALAAPGRAAITVSDVAVTPKAGVAGTLIIQYRLNEAATSVSINVSNGTTLTGTAAKGLNTVEYAPPTTGLTATITATAPAENGAGGAVQLMPAMTPPGTSALTGLDFFLRPDSPQRDHLMAAAGYAVTNKNAYLLASDGTLLVTKDVKAWGGGSYPFGAAVALGDPQDRVYIANRTGATLQAFLPTANPYDLVTSADLTIKTDANGNNVSTNNYVGLAVTPNTLTTDNAQDYNIWLADNKNGRVRHILADYSTAKPTWALADPSTVAQSNTSGATGNDDPQDIAVDPTNQVMFKAQVHDSGVGPISETDPNNVGASANLNKWTSSDGGKTWTMDATWSTNIIGFNGIPSPERVSAYGLSLGAGFDANNLAASTIWVAVGGAAADPSPAIRAIYHVRADTGEIIPADTIDLSQVAASGTVALNDKYPRYLSVDRKGNIAAALGSASAFSASAFTILAPNTAGATSDSLSGVSLEPPLSLVPKPASQSDVGNSGTAQVTFTAEVFDPAGIVADNAVVTADLTKIGGAADATLTRGTVSADGKTATYTITYTVPPTAAAGTMDLPVSVATMGGKTAEAFLHVNVYNALVPAWTASVQGGVHSSPATNGTASYIGTDSGLVYAFDKTGAPLASFGGGSPVSVGEPVRGQLIVANGFLYVAGTTKVFILNSGTGAQVAASGTIPNPFIAVTPDSSDANLSNKLIVGGSDNKLRVLNALTGAQTAISDDLGAPINRVALVPTNASSYFTFEAVGYLVVAGTDSFTDANNVTGGRIYMLGLKDLKGVFNDNNNFGTPLAYVDPKGAVKSRAAAGLFADGSGNHLFVIGGASGLWGVNAETGELLAWTVDGSLGSNGNPYATSLAADPADPVDANPALSGAIGVTGPTAHFATVSGNLFGIDVSNGARLSFAGDPIALVPGDGGFAAGAGVLAYQNERLQDTNQRRMVFIGSDEQDKRFYGILRDADSSAYLATPNNRYLFDPADTNTFPGAVPGAFNSTPALASDTVVVGSAIDASTGRFYGFPMPVVKTAPGVASISPANGASGVATNPTITVTFSGDVDTTTLGGIALFQNGAPVAASVAQGADAKTVVITPSSALQADKTYAVVVTGVQAPNGAAVATFSSTFYTGTINVPGDVNGDGVFNLADVKALISIAGGLSPATAQALAQGDKAAPSGKITLEDAVALRRLLP